jgi:hypothetical protein
MRPFLFSLFLPSLTLAALLPVLDPGSPNPLNAQAHLDHCGSTPITTTVAYDTAHKLKGDGACPNHYWKVNENGCCKDDAAAKTLLKGVGCCPCGAACTGYLPEPTAEGGKKKKMGELIRE